jgi:hypothetical protein
VPGWAPAALATAHHEPGTLGVQNFAGGDGELDR